MSTAQLRILVVGATGSIGRLVVEEALRAGYAVRALVRNLSAAKALPAQAERVRGDLTVPESLAAAVDGVDAVVFTHGSSRDSKVEAERVDYGAVRNVLDALHGRPVRIALMTAIGVTNRASAYNQATGLHDWKRRAERLVRASGLPYTVTVSGGPAPVRAYIDELLPDVLDGHIEPGLVFDRTVGIDDVPAGCQAMNRRESIKVMVRP